jgi:hypothetical protein
LARGSSSRYSPYNTPAPGFLATVKDELVEVASSRRRRHGGRNGALVIRDPSPSRHREWAPPAEYKAAASIVRAEDDLEDFPGLRQAQLESFAATDAFAEMWSASDYRREEEEHHRRLGLIINLDEDDEATLSEGGGPRRR